MQQKPAIIFLVAAVVLGVVWFFNQPDPVNSGLRIREVAARGLVEELGRAHPGGRILVLSNPFAKQPGTAPEIVAIEQAGIAGVTAGAGKALTIGAVAVPELRPEARENPAAELAGVNTTTPISFLMTPDAIDKLVKQHADCGLVVSLVGLPEELGACQAWNAPGGPRFAFLLPDFRGIADGATIVQAVKSGKVVAFVLPKPGAPGNDGKVSGDFQAEFEKRFVLVTARNVDQVRQSWPTLF